MKKTIINIGIFMLTLSAGAFAQSTTISTNPNQTTVDTSKNANSGGAKAATGSKPDSTAGKATGSAAKATPAAQPAAGTAAGGNTANTSQSTTQSTPASEAATAKGLAAQKIANDQKGAVTRTAPDTVLKNGSGAGAKNMKDKTGKTGNYKGEAYKKSNPR